MVMRLLRLAKIWPEGAGWGGAFGGRSFLENVLITGRVVSFDAEGGVAGVDFDEDDNIVGDFCRHSVSRKSMKKNPAAGTEPETNKSLTLSKETLEKKIPTPVCAMQRKQK